jgi:arylsulfatase A-like enzyme
MSPAAGYNVALIIIDDLRADHVSAYGYSRNTTPRLDARARTATRFENCMSCTGWTLSGCASILTGQPPDAHGLVDHNRRFQKPKIGAYLAETHRRVAFTNNGNTIPDTVSIDYLESLGMTRKPAKWKFFGWDEDFDEFDWTHREEHLEPFDKAENFLVGARKSTEPYFMLFHTNLVHDYHMERDYYLDVQDWLGRDIHPSLRDFRDGPEIWQNPPPGVDRERLTEDLIAKYDSGIRKTDELLDRLLAQVDFSNTIVVVVSDHGEGFDQELGRVHHCGRLHQDLLHVPLLVWLPPALAKTFALPREESRYCSTIDIAPTILTCVDVVTDGFPGRNLFDLSTHRRIEGHDQGYIYWGQDCVRESYDTARIKIRSKLTYPLKHIRVRKNDVERHEVYHLAYDPEERDNLVGHGASRRAEELEPVSFIVAVNDWKELEANLLDSPVAKSAKHEWILVDNSDGHGSDGISKVYDDAARRAKNDLLFFMHQDLYLPHGWEARVATGLRELEAQDPNWGVLGAVGAILAADNADAPKELRGHWCDPHGYFSFGPLPHEVESLDEQWLGFRKSRGVGFDAELPGFHCYGIDLSLTAREGSHKSYAIDAFVWHKYRDRDGYLIRSKEDSAKICERWSDGFMRGFSPSADFVEKKWAKYLPFQTTSWAWK